MKGRIGFIIPQFGVMPNYADYFMISASYAADNIDFIFITDHCIKRSLIKNVFFEPMTLNEFHLLTREKLGSNFRIKNPYKLCDLKPMYGLIFEDYLTDYEYWGHCDFDMILGDVNGLLEHHKYDTYDIFCVQEKYASGPFQIFRNVEKVNRLFMQSVSWKEILVQPQYVGFDEAGDIIKDLWQGKKIEECPTKVQSFTHLLKNEILLQKLQIKVSMKKLIKEDFEDGTVIEFNKGKLFLLPQHEEIYIYHFLTLKGLSFFNDLLLRKNIATFQFSKTGFYTGNKFEFVIGLIHSVLKRYWLRLKKKLVYT